MKSVCAENIVRKFGRTTEEIFSLKEFRKKLESGKKLNIKFGADVTAPLLHIGHGVNLWMMRGLQELGHKVQFLIGDFTTRIGDPTGKDQTRKIISTEEIEQNAGEFIGQVSNILITENPDVFEVRRNSEWFDSANCGKLLSLFSDVTYQRLISRDMFRKRIENGKEIRMHEMIYPILQGWDSVELKSDLTIVGSDQLFNEMMGRFFQEKYGQDPQVIITTKITPGLDGKQKQSKSLNNFVAITDPPRQKFGKVMSLPDRLIAAWFRVYTEVQEGKIGEIEKDLARGINPMEKKLMLAAEITSRYHGRETAAEEREWFVSTFSKKEFPDTAEERFLPKGQYTIIEFLSKLLPERSNSELRRLITQGAVWINGNRESDDKSRVTALDRMEIRVGRKIFLRVTGI
ncbi:MAG: tyrosine--tRNA ligase [Spirochaetia bacterium]